jgi:ferredoxin-NADP reductase
MISKNVKESDDMMSFYFKKDINVGTKCQSQEYIQKEIKPDLLLPSFVPEQFLYVLFQLPNQTLLRSYLIFNAPSEMLYVSL